MSTPDPSDLASAPFPADWPWRELNELADHLAREIAGGVTRIMREAGENPGSLPLFDLRCRQVGHRLGQQSSRIWAPLMPPELPPALANHAFGRSGCQLVSDEPLLAARARGSAAECAADAAGLIRQGQQLTEARHLLESALAYLDTYETRRGYPS